MAKSQRATEKLGSTQHWLTTTRTIVTIATSATVSIKCGKPKLLMSGVQYH